MKVRDLLLMGTKLLSHHGVPEPYQNVERIIMHALNIPRTTLYSESNTELMEADYRRIQSLLQRRKLHEPLQYILGYAGFYGFNFIVTRDVLIPRPETELIIDYALDNIKSKGEILDIGTGTGNIAITIKKLLPGTKVFALDISESAIRIAKLNAILHGVYEYINFIVSDLFDSLFPKHKFDAILSNPPYIPTGSIQNLMREVSEHEPIIALDGGMDGTKYICEIIKLAQFYLRSGGILILEIDENQGDKAISTAEMTGEYCRIEVKRDLAGLERIFVARRK